MKNPLKHEMPCFTLIQVIADYFKNHKGTNKIYILKHKKRKYKPDLHYYLHCFDNTLSCIERLDSVIEDISPRVFNEIQKTYQLKKSDLVVSIGNKSCHYYKCNGHKSSLNFEQLKLNFTDKLLILYRVQEYNQLYVEWHNF